MERLRDLDVNVVKVNTMIMPASGVAVAARCVRSAVEEAVVTLQPGQKTLFNV